MRLPHPIPYQGSKRNLAPIISPFVSRRVETWFEPFAGSAAMTLWAAHAGIAKRYVIADSLDAISHLWKAIIERPGNTAKRYRGIWEGGRIGGLDYFNEVRARYNDERDPVDLLYLVCRCVKNAVRFNASGVFTQSVDKRRYGMHPDKMDHAIKGASALLRGRTEVCCGDWLETLRGATPRDFVYMDPPYLGTSVGRDKRYAHQISQERLIGGLEILLTKKLRFALSYDGRTGEKEYGPPLPASLGMTRLLLHAGVSSQATLSGRREETIESLYMSPGLAEPRAEIIRRKEAAQESLAL